MRRAESQDEPLLSIVVPAYNEEDSLKRGVLEQIADCIDRQDLPCEALIVDDGSEDDTAPAAEEFCRGRPDFRLLREEHHGKACTVRAGMLAARGKYQLFMDMDLATSLDHVPQFIEALQRGTDVAIASRAKKGAVVTGAPQSRFVLGKSFNFLVQTLLLPGIADTQCGFKAFRSDVARDLFGSLVVFQNSVKPAKGPMVTAFDVELLVLARRRGYTIEEIPVQWRYYATNRVSPVKDAYRMFREVAYVWLNDRRGKYSVAANPATDANGMV